MPQDAKLFSTLERARKELLDLTARNRLLNTSRNGSQSSRLEIVGESSTDVFQQLVAGKKSMTFQAVPGKARTDATDKPSSQSLFQLDDYDDVGVAGVPGDLILQTALKPDQLQRKLLKLSYDAKTFEEEQGVSILYLALGFLKWFEDDNSDVERYAPLLLIPVELEGRPATSKFRLRYTDDDITTNLSLQARLKKDFGIELPEVPDVDELDPANYFECVAEAIRTEPRFQVVSNDIVLWFFSFSKFLMYRDLLPESWPKGRELENNGMIRGLLQTGFRGDSPLCGDDENIDGLIKPVDMVHVLDSDSSQTVVIEEVKRGRNLVIQGPPGTGKSQTIANLISSAVNAGKTVLFVAEKMAALDVVHSRLQGVGLGDMCLELHSNKAKKKEVLEKLNQTLQLSPPRIENGSQICAELTSSQGLLNEHLRAIHTPIQPSNLTPYQIVGELVRLRTRGTPPPKFQFAHSLQWTQDEFKRRLGTLRQLANDIALSGPANVHPWRGVALETILPSDVDQIRLKVSSLIARIESLRRCAIILAQAFRLAPTNAIELSNVTRLVIRLTEAPPMDRKSIGNPVWSQQREEIGQLIASGRRLAECRSKLASVVSDAAWGSDFTAARRVIGTYGHSWFRFLFPSFQNALSELRDVLVNPLPKRQEDRIAILDTLLGAQNATNHLNQETSTKLGGEAFGNFWKGANSDWDRLSAIANWEAQCSKEAACENVRRIFASLDSMPDCKSVLKQVITDLKPSQDELKDLFESLKLSLPEAFDTNNFFTIPFDVLLSRLRQWNEKSEALSSWIVYYGRARRLARDGFQPIVEQLHKGETPASEAVALAEQAHYDVLIRDTWQKRPVLADFHGNSHEQNLQRFKELDGARVKLARQEVAMAHFERIPRAKSSIGGVGIILREIEKKSRHSKSRHLSIRKLLESAGPAVQAIKPVFMMSPMSLAKYLAPGAIEFDLLVIDEASQVQPVDALGAAARAKQIVVVGDSKQLPPSQWFSRMLEEEELDDEAIDAVNAGNMESILGLCCAQGVPQRMLRWHYRSRHHSLIAVSNHEFYRDRLYVFPSPSDPAPNQGLSFQYVPGGEFGRGGTRTNRIEA